MARVAGEHGVSRAQVALAWVRQQEAVTAPIAVEHLEDAVASVDPTLGEDELKALSADHAPRFAKGFSQRRACAAFSAPAPDTISLEIDGISNRRMA